MRTIMLEFVAKHELDQLLSDQEFQKEINYLNPTRMGEKILLNDPIEQHSSIDSEIVVLSIFSCAIKRILFPSTKYQIEFLNPFANQQKGGLSHNLQIIIESTTIQRT